tara:strand:+ start:680 stop:913 length:234 start_codon:yes stop_codon:yes gene_type:complete
MSIVDIKLSQSDYVTRADLELGDFFEYRGSIWICTEAKGLPGRSDQAVDLSDGFAAAFIDDQQLVFIPRVKIVSQTI